MKDAVDKLAKLTDKGQVPWKTTVDKAAFAATFGGMSVLISTKDTSPRSGFKLYRLSVLDEQGNEIDFASATDDPLVREVGEIYAVVPLYISSKRAALDVERRLEELLSEMDRVSGS